MDKIVKIWIKYHNVFLQGLAETLWISAVTVVFAVIVGTLIALLRMSKRKPLSLIARAYIETLRGTPVLLQLYLFWLGIPKLFPALDPSDTTCIVIALIVNSSAYIAEIVRAGIGAVDKGQWEAARSIGLSERHVMSKVILPQAVKNILPALGNEFISTIKGTSLASVFFIGELTTSYKTVQSATFLSVPPLIISGIIYLIVNYTLSKLVQLMERRLQASDR